MATELFYELKNGKLLLYDTDGDPSDGEEQHIRYLRQASINAEGTQDLEGLLGKIIAQQLPKVPRRIKHRDRPTFEFTAKPINRGYQPPELPKVSGQYANPYYQSAEGEKRV